MENTELIYNVVDGNAPHEGIEDRSSNSQLRNHWDRACGGKTTRYPTLNTQIYFNLYKAPDHFILEDF